MSVLFFMFIYLFIILAFSNLKQIFLVCLLIQLHESCCKVSKFMI